MDAILAHPFTLLVVAWVASRLGTLVEVRARVGHDFSLPRYFELRWPQILHGSFWTLATYGLLVATDQATPIFAFGAGIAADQIIERVTGVKAKASRRGAPSDITRIADEYQRATGSVAERDEA